MTQDYEPDFSASSRFPESRSYGGGFEGSRGGYFGGHAAGGARSSGYNGFGNLQTGRSGYGPSAGSSMAPIDASKLDPIIKNVYKEHPDVTAQSTDQVMEFRRQGEMTIQGKNVPKYARQRLPVTMCNNAFY